MLGQWEIVGVISTIMGFTPTWATHIIDCVKQALGCSKPRLK